MPPSCRSVPHDLISSSICTVRSPSTGATDCTPKPLPRDGMKTEGRMLRMAYGTPRDVGWTKLPPHRMGTMATFTAGKNARDKWPPSAGLEPHPTAPETALGWNDADPDRGAARLAADGSPRTEPKPTQLRHMLDALHIRHENQRILVGSRLGIRRKPRS